MIYVKPEKDEDPKYIKNFRSKDRTQQGDSKVYEQTNHRRGRNKQGQGTCERKNLPHQESGKYNIKQ